MELRAAWNDMFDRFCAIEDMIEALKCDQDEKDIVRNGETWLELQRQIDALINDRKEVDRRLYSLKMDIEIFRGY